MKGQILGFDGQKGAITGEDGNRYSFELAEWKSDKVPQPRDNVDFVAVEGAATEIYKTAGSFAAPSLGGVGASLSGVADRVDLDAGKLEYIRTRPALIFIGLAIFAFFFLNFIVLPSSGHSAFALPGDLDEIARPLGFFGAGGEFGFASTFAYLLYIVPAAGGFAIFREVTGKRSRKAELATAAACLASVLVYFVVALAFESINGGSRVSVLEIMDFGFGGWLMVLCGIGLLLTTLGIVKTVPGWPAPAGAQPTE
ncbi:MAG: hypothetical protein V2J14_09200 [Erythrobacter sp.]|jgi:hypothetical protein|nr:hypothetical protein [Erythrobacter sp.]